MKYFFNFLKKIIIISLFLGLFSFLIILFFLWKYSPELPSYDELKNYNPNLSSRVFTSDGLLLDKYFIEERIFVPIDRIPDNLINALIKLFGILSIGTNILSSIKYLSSKTPSDVKTLDDKLGL